MPVEARGKLFCSFPRSGGRAFFASTAPTASTGASSVAHLPNWRPRDVTVFVPWMIRRRVRAARWRGGGVTWRARDRLGRPDAGRGARRDLGPPHDTVAIPNLQVSLDAFTHHHRAAGRRVTALPLELQAAVVIPHDPVIGDGAGFFQPKHAVESQPARARHVKVVRRRRRLREAGIVVGPGTSVSRKAFAVSRSAMPFRRSFFTRRSCWVP